MNPAALTPEQEAIAQRTAALVVAYRSPILTRDEAMTYVKIASVRTFFRWLSRHRVQCAAPGRYSRRALDLALEREAAPRVMRSRKQAA